MAGQKSRQHRRNAYIIYNTQVDFSEVVTWSLYLNDYGETSMNQNASKEAWHSVHGPFKSTTNKYLQWSRYSISGSISGRIGYDDYPSNINNYWLRLTREDKARSNWRLPSPTNHRELVTSNKFNYLLEICDNLAHSDATFSRPPLSTTSGHHRNRSSWQLLLRAKDGNNSPRNVSEGGFIGAQIHSSQMPEVSPICNA